MGGWRKLPLAFLQDGAEARNLGGFKKRVYCSCIYPGISQYKLIILIVTFIFSVRPGKKITNFLGLR